MNGNQHLSPESKGGGPVAWARGDAGTQLALTAGAHRRTLGDVHCAPQQLCPPQRRGLLRTPSVWGVKGRVGPRAVTPFQFAGGS